MGICRNCGCEIIRGDGLCEGCGQTIADERSMNKNTEGIILFLWNKILKPFVPAVAILTTYEYLVSQMIDITNGTVITQIIKYLGHIITTLILGWLCKKNIHKGLWKSFWPKAFIFYTGMLFIRYGLRIIYFAFGMFQYNTQAFIASIIFITLGIMQTIWIMQTNRTAKIQANEIDF